MKKIHFRKKIDFGFGYSVPILLKKGNLEIAGAPAAGLTTYTGAKDGTIIEIDTTEPTWEQIKAYGHEVLHAANEFHRWLEQVHAMPMLKEALETERILRGKEEEEED